MRQIPYRSAYAPPVSGILVDAPLSSAASEMRLFSPRIFTPTQSRRLNEATGFLFLASGILLLLSLASFHPQDRSWDTDADRAAHALNLIGKVGANVSDVFLQGFGLAAFLFPFLIFALGYKWIRSEVVHTPLLKTTGSIVMVLSACGAAALLPDWRIFDHSVMLGGIAGFLVADTLRHILNPVGAGVVLATALILSTYLVSAFTLAALDRWMLPFVILYRNLIQTLRRNAELRRERALQRAERKRIEQETRLAARAASREAAARTVEVPVRREMLPVVPQPDPAVTRRTMAQPKNQTIDTPPWEDAPANPAYTDEIPICALNDMPDHAAGTVLDTPVAKPAKREAPRNPAFYRLPDTEFLNEIPMRSSFDEQELKNTASAIKSKFEEFHVTGSVVQINPGPVVTTFEYKPEAGVKYSKIINLREDLCLGLQAESILIERIPGKQTIGIEVPNIKREIISLRAILESDEFRNSASPLTISMGKDISGRIKVAALETMPHLLIAGSTGSGKSVMINSLIMSVLYKSTPDEVRMIMVDPKRVELGMYEGIPHLLTPVITDPRKATNALRNAVLEMERRLRLLAEQGARNIDQYNKKIAKLRNEPRSLFEDQNPDANPRATPKEELKPLPYVLILIDELADLMMLEGRNVEESVTRLAQMARAVGMHLVLATQRPSVDVITGIIKANFPARVSFRVATRVDSRTVLDGMGAEHLLGKGDMLFLPPGSSRLIRVHGAYVSETETTRVVDFWKEQAQPDYDQSYLIAPPSEDGETEVDDPAVSGDQDPMYEDALRVVLEMGKASTSTLQRRLRLGYGRAARILDMMYKDGIIGPPDGSKPREVLRRPDWVREVDPVI